MIWDGRYAPLVMHTIAYPDMPLLLVSTLVLIIDCVVYITTCKQCEMNTKEEMTVDNDDTFWQSSNTQKDDLTIKRALVDPLELNQLVTPEEMLTNITDNNTRPNCPCNYSSLSISMESDSRLYLIKRLYRVMKEILFYEYIVNDDDNKIK